MTTTPDGRLLRMFTIYDHPADHPDHFVVRGWTIGPGAPIPDDEVLLADTLELARELVPPASDTCLPRQPNDDPKIIETWL